MMQQRIYTRGEVVGRVDLASIVGPSAVPMLPSFWHILLVHPNRETKVMRAFHQRNISAWLPMITTRQELHRYRRGFEWIERRNVTSPLISGAILIPDFESVAGRWRDVDGIIGVYRMGPCTPRLTPQLITDLRNIEAIGNTPKSKRERMFELGQLVRVVNGPFRSFSARVERFDSPGRLSVGVEIFGRITPIEIGEGDIEAV